MTIINCIPQKLPPSVMHFLDVEAKVDDDDESSVEDSEDGTFLGL